ncbi:MAG: gas vesicle protein GvpK [Planctomycetes bacterium RBG_13_63_9]|nr:MAG: gas vesicle protein GvpK [Planctomycetes bacterium RBG_13_63_9]
MITCAELFSDVSPLGLDRQSSVTAPTTDLPSRIQLNPDNVRNGLAQLVLTLVELLRELLERQALRRIDGGSLTEGEVERLGETFLRLAEEIEKLKEYFGFTDEDLNLNLGPLGKLR